MSHRFSMKSVESSNISEIGYDEATKTLRVHFRGGGQYEYDGVSPEAHEALMDSDSKGRHLHRHVISRHEARRMHQ